MFWSKITCELKFCLVYLTTCYGVPLKVEEMVTNFIYCTGNRNTSRIDDLFNFQLIAECEQIFISSTELLPQLIVYLVIILFLSSLL